MITSARFISKFGKKELDHFFTNAKLVKKNQAFTILSMLGQKKTGRILIIIPKKYGNAPERNRLRRQIKSIFIQHHLYTHLQDTVIITRPTARNYDFINLKNLICNLF
jgi:ribonuclease P protein component